MNILRKFTWKYMRKNKARTTVTVVGIILSAAMFMAVTTLGYSLWDYMVRREVYNTGDYFLRFDYITEEHSGSLIQDDRISHAGHLAILGYTTVSTALEENPSGSESYIVAAGDQAFFSMVSVHLEKGRLPQSSDEIVISSAMYYHLSRYGRPCKVGESITLDAVPDLNSFEGDFSLPASGTPFTKTYTIVGISEHSVPLYDYELDLGHLLTFHDDTDAPIWYRLYLKTEVPKDAYRIITEYADDGTISSNSDLLNLYGATAYNNYNQAIIRICGILAAIIVTGSVSLIYNAFCISVSEHTKQFGLIASVGATRKQIRACVFSEAMFLCALGIPIGLISGYAGISVTLNLLSDRIHTILSSGRGSVLLEPKLSWLTLCVAAVIALVTVLVSAAIPARRAARITPINAIRQKNDYQIPKKGLRSGKFLSSLFGLPGMLSAKYYNVSRGKYRATVISLVISVVLFISAATISQTIESTVRTSINIESFDMECYGTKETLETIRSQDFVEKSVYLTDRYYVTHVPDSLLADTFLEQWPTIHKAFQSLDKNFHDVRLLYMEDTAFRQYLSEHGIPEEQYFSQDTPTALQVKKEVPIYEKNRDTGELKRFACSYEVYKDGSILRLLGNVVPKGLDPYKGEASGYASYDYYSTETGDPIFAVTPLRETEDGKMMEDTENRIAYVIQWEEGADGKLYISYYLRDPVDGKIAETATVTIEATAPQIRVGGAIEVPPFGVSSTAVSNQHYDCLILPLSAAPEDPNNGPTLCITVSDYPAAKAYMDANLGVHNYRDYRASEEQNRTLILLIHVFSYGFIILISLICVANIFNTISTNVALRRRDFGMLRSTGFRKKDLLRMMHYECLIYGCKALLWGLPIGLFLSFMIQRVENSITVATFEPPWSAVFTATLCVFLVVFITMFYAVSKLRKDNPIDAIRMENI